MYAGSDLYPLHRIRPDGGGYMYPGLVKNTRRTDGWGRESINLSAEYSTPCICFGGEKTAESPVVQDIWGSRALAYSQIYRFGFNLDLLKDESLQRLGVGGFAPNGSIHLGHLQHVQALKDSNIDFMVASFNDIEARFVRGATDEEIGRAIGSFEVVFNGEADIEQRTQVPELMDLYHYFNREVTLEDMFMVFGRDLNRAELESVNLQAAAYLWRSVNNPNVIPVGYDGIEELKRMIYINHLAQTKLGLPGGVFFISPQIHGWNPDLKMGKSNPGGSLMVGDSLDDALARISFLEDTSSSRHMLRMIAFLLSDDRSVLSEIDTDFQVLQETASANLIANHQSIFPLT